MKQLSFENTGEFVMERVIFHLTKAGDCSYIAEVLELPGCTANGSLYQKVLNSTEKVIKDD